MMMTYARALALAALCMAASTAPGAPPQEDEGPFGSFRYDDVQPEAKESPAETTLKPVPEFGSIGSRWWTIGGGVAHGFNDSTDTEIALTYSYFLARDVEFAAELGGWYFNQVGDNTVGSSLVMIFRWHFVDSGPWTVYADAGIGFLVAGDVVPDGGTGFDLMPRLGAGFTRRLTDDGLRLQVGLRWHHISNARIEGDKNNPARDELMLYGGLIFPF